MEFVDDWGSVGSVSSDAEGQHNSIVGLEGASMSLAPLEPQFMLSFLAPAASGSYAQGGPALGQASTSGRPVHPPLVLPGLGQTGSRLLAGIMRPMLESMEDLRKGMSLLHEGQSTLSGVTASFQRRSALALQRVQELEQEKAVMEHQFKTQIDIMQYAMKEQLSVSKEAVSTINALRHELAATQAESHRLHSKMHDWKWVSSPLAGPSAKPTGFAQFADTANSLTAHIFKLEQQIHERLGGGLEASSSERPQPSAPDAPKD